MVLRASNGKSIRSSQTSALPRRCALLAFAAAASVWGVVRADQANNANVNAVGLKTTAAAGAGAGAALTGSGVKIVVTEAYSPTATNGGNPSGGGVPQLSPANPNMPAAGPAAGASGKVTYVNNTFLPAVGNPPYAPVLGDHATMVNGVIMGSGAVAGGIAPQSTDFTTSIVNNSDLIQITQSLIRSDTGPNASIINESWGGSGTANNGNELDTEWQDWAALTNPAFLMHNKLFVVAGNETSNPGPGTEPFDNFNAITVGATSGPGGQFLADYNNNSINAGTSNITADGRFKTDIVAPGGGPYGNGAGNSAIQSPVVVNGDPSATNNATNNDNYAGAGSVGAAGDGINSNPNFAGTSFAAPMVTGAASLLTQDATADGFANIDHNALKALILNGATHNVSWFNKATGKNVAWQAFGANGTKAGGTPINIGWDSNLGTGLLNVGNSQANLDAGEYAPGNVPLEGWDYEGLPGTGRVSTMTVATSAANYVLPVLNAAITSVTATLTWDRRDQLVLGGGNTNTQLWLPGDTFTTPGLNDLDLKLIDLTTGGNTVYQSDSAVDSIQYISYAVPQANALNQYELQVYYFQQNDANTPVTPYGLAWNVAVPEPTTLGTLLAGGMLLLARRRRGARGNA